MTNQIELRITERTAFAGDHSFGDVGPYERLTGRAHFAVDPLAPAQAAIVDIDKASRNAAGLVEFTADIFILKPVVQQQGNQRLLFGYGNRGNKRELQFFNDAPGSNDPRTLKHAGNGFLMRRGYTVVWAAWEGDLLPGDGRLLLDVPIATEDGTPIIGLVRSEFIAETPGKTCFPLSTKASTRSYPTVSLDTTKAQLTRRRYADDPREPVPPKDWQFARIEGGRGLDAQGAETAIVASHEHIYLPAGFNTSWIYELVYTATEPRVMGLGHVVVRDLVSFLCNDDQDVAGQPNPLAGGIDKAYAWGRSQTGRCIRDFIYLGFNADAHGRQVFDGVLPHVSGGGLMWMNHRFANVCSPAGQQYEDHVNCADRFPFSYAHSTDHLTGNNDAILKRPGTDPLIIHTQTATEYWQRRGSLVHTDTQGNDLAQPDSVRIYMWSSSQHFADPTATHPVRVITTHYENIVQTSMLFRAALDALDRWASAGIAPPPSRIPLRSDSTLVDYAQWRTQFPAIPGAAIPRCINPLPRYDFGADFVRGLLTNEPPIIADDGGYTTLVPAVDADGNDIAGVRVPMVQAPLGTYTGWNLRARGFGNGAMYEFTGGYIPLPDSAQERHNIGDPRPSVLERFGDPAGYTNAITVAAEALVAAGLMLAEDLPRVIEASEDWGRPLHDVRL